MKRSAKSAKKKSKPQIDFNAIAEEFRTLDLQDPGTWTLLPRIVILIGIFVVLVTLAAWFGWQPQIEELESERRQESGLKFDWLARKKKAVNLDAYRNQLTEIERSFTTLLRKLPNTSEIESLLTDINQAGLGGGLQFELFKPANEVRREFYAELPIDIRLTGSYDDFGAFASDVAKLPRIVTLDDISITRSQAKDERRLKMEVRARTFRYLENSAGTQWGSK